MSALNQHNIEFVVDIITLFVIDDLLDSTIAEPISNQSFYEGKMFNM